MANSEKWHPCSLEQGFCSSMARRIKFPGEKGYGFFALMVIKRSDLEKTQAQEKLKGVMYKSDKKDNGLMMNFCPFCGSKIDWFRENGTAPENKPEETPRDVQA
jgi:hypothetical protein